MVSNRKWHHRLGDSIGDFVTGESGRWIIWQGLIITFYILYGLGSYLIDTRDRAWWPVALCGVVAFLVPLVSYRWVLSCKGKFWSGDDKENPGRQLLASFGGASGVFVATLAAQICLILVYHPHDFAVWAVSFALISTGLAGFGSYFFIGDPGMANLASLDRWLPRHWSSQKSTGDLPKALVGGLEAELAMLRSITTGLIYLYVFVGAGVLLGLDKVGVLLGEKDFATVSLGGKIWFIVGVALLLVGCHASVTGLVYGRYYGIARWLRRSCTTGREEDTGSDSRQAVE